MKTSEGLTREQANWLIDQFNGILCVRFSASANSFVDSTAVDSVPQAEINLTFNMVWDTL